MTWLGLHGVRVGGYLAFELLAWAGALSVYPSSSEESDRRKEFLFGIAYSMGLRSDILVLLC
jgi:hypothetical protein